MAEPASKRFCTARGKKNQSLHSLYHEYERGRVRCKECYQKWFDESVLVAIQNGTSESEAKVLVNSRAAPIESVPTFAKAGTEALKRHIRKIHPSSWEEENVVPASQPFIADALQSCKSKAPISAKKAALAHCMNPGLSFRMTSDPFFVESYGQPITKDKLPSIILEMAEELRVSIKRNIEGSDVSLAIDGWTNWRHRKVFNFVILWKGTAIFWKSVPSIFGKASNIMFELFKAVVANLELTLNVYVIALVADNENANKGLFKLIEQWRTWIVCVGCNAHGLQLVMQDVFSNVTLVRQAFQAVERICFFFPNKISDRLRIELRIELN